MENLSLIIFGLASSAFIAIAVSKYVNRPNLDAIPTIGPSGTFSSYLGVWRYMFHASDMVQEGYIKYKGKAFKIPNVYKWRVIVSGPELIEELHKAPDNELSFLEAANDVLTSFVSPLLKANNELMWLSYYILKSLKVEFTLGPEIHHNPYHIPIIRSQLTRNLGDIFSDIHDEMVTSFDDIIQVKDDEWVSVPVSDSIMQVVCRSSNRLFVGLPLCRDPDWIALNIQFAMDVFKGAITIDMFPQFMASVVAQFLTNLPRSIRRGIRHLQPVIEERKTYLKEYGDHWAEKPVHFHLYETV